MKRLYWKIVLTVGGALVIVLAVFWAVLDFSHDRHELRKRGERTAAIEFLKLALESGLSQGVSISDLEKFASSVVHGKVDISSVGVERLDRGGEAPREETIIHFKQGKTPLVMTIFPSKGGKGPKFELGLTLLATVASLILFAIPLASLVSSPLQRLREDMKQFASGDLEHRTDVSSKDEVGDLATDFNVMAESIQSMVRAGKDLTANVSHELRSPLTRIDLARQFLEEQAGSSQLIHLESMREEIEEMNGLIDRILQLSRLDLGMEQQSKVMCFAKMVNQVVNRNEMSFEAKGIELKLDSPESLRGNGIYDELVCLVDNLLSNSLKFTPQGGRTTVLLQKQGEEVVIDVTNDALKSVLEPERLVEPFQRGGVSESIPGSGLGLAIVKKIAENHGGSLDVGWREGKFSVSVSLPLSKA